MEILDLYDVRKNKINKTFVRDSEETKNGEFRQTVHVCLINKNKQLLIQLRSFNMRRNPGKWAFTGGLPVSGENSLEGAIRETKEELNIDLRPEEMELLITFRREHDFVDVWVARNNTNIEDIVMQKNEVEQVRWVSIDEMEKMISEGKFVPTISLYYDLLKKLLNKCYFNEE